MTLLNETLLQRFEDTLRATRTSVVDHLQPGLTDREIDRLTAAVDVRLPTEARAWWRWRNGVAPDARMSLVGDFRWLPLQMAIRDYGERREESVTLANQPWAVGPARDPEFVWPARFFPVIAASDGAIACDCSVSDGEPAPMRLVSWEGGPATAAATRSFAEMIEWWIEAVTSGGWAYDARVERLMPIWERLDPRRRATGII